MQMKKLLGIAMAAALVGSMATVAATSVSANGEGEVFTTLGAIGTLTGGWDSDVDMTDEDGDGIYSVTITDVKAKDADGNTVKYYFKVRSEDDWDAGIAWSVFDATQNDGAGATSYPGGSNIEATFEVDTDVTVTLDTNGEDYEQWPVSYSYVDANGEPQTVYCGNPATKPEPKPEPTPDPEPTGEKIFETLSVIGTINGNWDTDTDLTDEDGDGIWTAVIPNVAAGEEKAFKIRADHTWENGGLNWGIFMEGVTNNPVDNDVKFTLAAVSDVTVSFDTTLGEDLYDQWAISYSYVDANGEPQTVFCGNPDQSKPDDKKDDDKKDDDKKDDDKKDDDKKDDAAKTRQTERNEYIYFDNSNTKWETVCAYWWEDSFARTYDKISGEDYGWVAGTNEDGTPNNKPVPFPGTAMTKIEGTDIWQIRIPFGATKIIFNSGKTDAEVKTGVNAYQSADLAFDEVANAGQVYTVDLASGQAGKLKLKTKTTYKEGAWAAYEGAYTAEEVAVAAEPTSKPTSEPTSKPASEPTSNVPAPSSQPSVPTTGDATMPVALVIVALAAAGAVVAMSKKKTQE